MTRRRPLLVLVALATVAALGIAYTVQALSSEEPVVIVAGKEEVVFDWSEQACADEDFPDLPVRAFRDARGRVQLLLSHFKTRRLVGPDFDRLEHPCDVVSASHENRDPSAFDDREWIAATYTLDGRTVYALVHHEYQGHRHTGKCASGDYFRCWDNAITFAVSTDGGATYLHRSPPQHLVAALPYRYRADGGPTGLFTPSGIVRNPHDGFFYTFVRAASRGRQERGVCLLRTATLAEPVSWRAWDGDSFSVRLVDPYARRVNPDEHVCAPVHRPRIQEMTSSLTYSSVLRRFLLVGIASKRPHGGSRDVWGVYASTSSNLLHWSPPRLVLQAELRWTHQCGDSAPIAYPALIDHDSPSRSFDIVGARAHLYFTRSNYSRCRETSDRDLVRVPVEIAGS